VQAIQAGRSDAEAQHRLQSHTTGTRGVACECIQGVPWRRRSPASRTPWPLRPLTCVQRIGCCCTSGRGAAGTIAWWWAGDAAADPAPGPGGAACCCCWVYVTRLLAPSDGVTAPGWCAAAGGGGSGSGGTRLNASSISAAFRPFFSRKERFAASAEPRTCGRGGNQQLLTLQI
jgi:hypothetical protein